MELPLDGIRYEQLIDLYYRSCLESEVLISKKEKIEYYSNKREVKPVIMPPEKTYHSDEYIEESLKRRENRKLQYIIDVYDRIKNIKAIKIIYGVCFFCSVLSVAFLITMALGLFTISTPALVTLVIAAIISTLITAEDIILTDLSSRREGDIIIWKQMDENKSFDYHAHEKALEYNEKVLMHYTKLLTSVNNDMEANDNFRKEILERIFALRYVANPNFSLTLNSLRDESQQEFAEEIVKAGRERQPNLTLNMYKIPGKS